MFFKRDNEPYDEDDKDMWLGCAAVIIILIAFSFICHIAWTFVFWLFKR